MQYQFFLREENGQTLQVKNVPGDAIDTCGGDGMYIEIDFDKLQLYEYYFLIANSTVYIVQRTENETIILTPSDQMIRQFEEDTGLKIPRQSIEEISYEIIPRLPD